MEPTVLRVLYSAEHDLFLRQLEDGDWAVYTRERHENMDIDDVDRDDYIEL